MKTNKSEITTSKSVEADANRDPLTGAHGSHPVGVGTGAAGGGAAGALAGAAVAGPIGAAVGAVAGAVAGGLAGKEAAELINPTVEHAYWRNEHRNRSYFTPGTPYEQYGPAYQFGWESCTSHKGKSFEDVESQLGRDWARRCGESKLSWKYAKNAAHDAWQRVEKTIRGDCCGSA